MPKAQKIWASSEPSLMSYANLIQGVPVPPFHSSVRTIGLRIKWKFPNWGILKLLKAKKVSEHKGKFECYIINKS